MSPEEGCEDEQRTGAPLLGRKADRTEALQPGEGKATGRPYCDLSVVKMGSQERREQMF